MAYDPNKSAQDNAGTFEFDMDKFRKGLADGVAKDKEKRARNNQTCRLYKSADAAAT